MMVGAERQILFLFPQQEKKFKEFLIKNEVAKIMFENGWHFMESADKICVHTQIDEIINDAVNLIERKKFEKKVERDCLKGIVYGTENRYHTSSFKLSLKAMIEMYKEKGLEFLQKEYDKVKASLGKDEKIFNTNLEELGVKL